MQILSSARCRYCGILLKGRDQFMGHMFHGHDEPICKAEIAWKSLVVDRESISP